MSDITDAIYTILTSDGAVSALVGTKVYPDYLPQGVTAPAVVSAVIAGDETVPIDDPGYSFQPSRIQFDCYGSNRGQANDLWLKVRTALIGAARSTVKGIQIREISPDSAHHYATDRVEAGSQSYRFITSQDFSFHYCLPVEA